MSENIFFLTICASLVIIFAVSLSLSFKGYAYVRNFLWTWALLLLIALPFMHHAPNKISAHVAGITLGLFFYVLYLINKKGLAKVKIAHEEIRRVLAESNNRMDEERRTISRRLHDDVNPNLVLCKHELQKLLPFVNDNEQARCIIEQVTNYISTAYQNSRDIIKNTRIEVIDSIGFTAAIESMVGHYKRVFETPIITLKHNLPKRPALSEIVAVNVYRIIQEALFNAIKHAEANNVAISIQHNKTFNRYDIEVVDDGIGIRLKNPSLQGAGIGLIDMRERARTLNSQLQIQQDSGGGKKTGTKISFSFSDQDL